MRAATVREGDAILRFGSRAAPDGRFHLLGESGGCSRRNSCAGAQSVGAMKATAARSVRPLPPPTA